MLGRIDKNVLSCLERIFSVKVVAGGGELSESVKKGKFITKIFFSDNAE